MHNIVQREIDKLEWQNDKGIHSPMQETIALLTAIDLLAFHIERIADALESQKEDKIWESKDS